MIKDDKKRVSTYIKKDDAHKIEDMARKNNISTSALIGIMISGVLAYESGKSVGDSFGKYLFGRKD